MKMVIGCVLLACAIVHAAAYRLENEVLVVEVSGQVLTMQAKPAGLVFVPRSVFPRRIERVAVGSVRDPVWGEGPQLDLTHRDGWVTQIRLYRKQPFVHIHTIAGNQTEEPMVMKRAQLMTYDVALGVPIDQLRVLGTPGLSGVKGSGSYTYSAVADPDTRRGIVSGWLTHERGVGVYFPKEADGRAYVDTQIEFGQFQVLPGKPRPVDTMVIGYFDDARLGLEAYGDAVARQYGITLKPQPGVYCTWYHAGASDERRIAANTEFAAKHLKPFGLTVMQIDDKWQAILPAGFPHEGKIQTTGPVKVFVDARENYPHGMAHTATVIASHGMVPGIWFMPFAGNFRNPYFDREIFATSPDGTPFHDGRWSGTCIDLSRPKAQAFVAQRVNRIYDWGYRYFKLDGMHTGAPSHNIYVHTAYRGDTFPESRLRDPAVTHIEAYRRGLQIVRQNAPEAFVLGCNVSQNMISMGPAFGLIDAMRIGPDNGSAGRGNWNAVKVGAWHGSTLYFLNGRVWHNDPDPVYVRPSNPLEKARLMCSWVAVTGSMLTASYQFAELPAERLDLLKRTLPWPGVTGRPADLFESNQARIWLLTDTRRNVRRDVIGLFNWEEKKAAVISYDMAKLGLEPDTTYAAFDFWSNRFVEPIRGTLTQTLPAGSCRVLAVRPAAHHPQLLSTSRHIAQCIVDVVEEQWDAKNRILRGTSRVVAGDRYELCIALPADGTWRVQQATAGQKTLDLGETSPRGVRLSFTPEAGGLMKWRIQF